MSKRGPKAPGFDAKRDVLFVGIGTSPVAYYRCFLPALALGCDWVGIAGAPPQVNWVTGLIGKESRLPNMMNDYKAVVIQQPAGKGWNQAIEKMRENGVKVFFEVDDYLHGIKHMQDHDFKAHFDNSHLWNIEQAMKRCNAVICSTEWIKGNYRHFNKQAFVCQNGIDSRRYDLTRPKRPTVNVGWAGGTGHLKAILPWLQQVANLMRMREDTTFVSLGQGFAEAFVEQFGEARSIAVPWAALEQYPAAMTMFDIAIAPGGSGGWWRGKSDLRWLEAGALGIPIIANPNVYPDVVDGETGFTAVNPMEFFEKLMILHGDADLRTRVGQQAKEHITEHRTIQKVAPRWVDVIQEVIEVSD